VEAGQNWGHRLASPADSSGSPAHRVIELLDELGFAPEVQTECAHQQAHEAGLDESSGEPVEVRLTRCPLLDAALEEPTVVCNVHLGLVAGALEEFGTEDPDARLIPFAEDGACLLYVPGGAGD